MTESFAPPEITAGLVLEVIAACCAEYMRLAEATPSAEQRDTLRQRGRALRESRWSFDPRSAAEVATALAAASHEFEVVTRLVAELDG